ncbi:hypothetical protein EO95_18620 [Methanosarcina sp. 1.H.T.1A.1]|uniref:YIP1 family protein n=1 Tax=unclassified Methanosarcina TaxID=2644672 RepID=UPI000620F593|nr:MULTISPECIES: YIP1 family protein [unclassified Methanosarcina]KKH45217.1 hypothetical protein EO93_14185 [Methanosarcina sp. 1.H.A.2.2]KKH94698.1 hypothetical protein EO95_18620 [Methanosarcina sp. 1.H.T.1A.1]
MSYIDTWKEVVFSPDRFFREMPKKGGYADPVVFTAMNTLVAGLLTSTVGRIFDPHLDVIWEAGNVSFLSGLLLLVIGVILLNFIYGAILHILFRLVGGTGSYQGTYRLVAYAEAPGIFDSVPVFHSIIYTPYLQTIGGKHVHNISTKRAAVAVLLPILLFLIGIFMLIGLENP